jgi:uncharacterized protein
MIYKILLLIAVIAAVYFFFFKTKPVAKKKKKPEQTEAKKLEGDETVECVTCGTYVALDDAIISNGKYYCSKECLNS